MKDPRLTQLAHNLINYSVRLQKGERVLIENTGLETEFVGELIAEAYKAGGYPYVWLRDASVTRAMLMGISPEQADFWSEQDAAFMKGVKCYIGVRAGDNATELSDVPSDKMKVYSKHYGQKVHSKIRVPSTRWVVLRYPTPSMAQAAGMSTEAFEDYYFKVCCLDYGKMDRAMDALKARMEKTDNVRIAGPGTDFTFSIKGIPAVKCAGEMNIPDGEIFTAPVRDSVNGTVTFNTPSLHDGDTFENISLTFKDGKIVQATSNLTDKLNEILDRDEGSRYVGEFAIGVNPYITFPMKDTLFDEKIAGSFHFTPGNCYDEAPNGNSSALHWDMVMIQTKEYGGGEMFFDGELIRKDGVFIPEDLHVLNPENLK